MDDPPTLEISYGDHEVVKRLREQLRSYLEAVALGFDRWGEDRVFGPGAYVAIVIGPSLTRFADPMGNNRWPADAPTDLHADPDGCFEAFETTTYNCDGALVVAVDGIVFPQFVRFRDVDHPTSQSYADWMGARHMSALDVSAHPEVVATLTLSQESGRITVFQDGSYESTVYEQLGDPWQEPV